MRAAATVPAVHTCARLLGVLAVTAGLLGCARLGGEAFQPTHNGVITLEPGVEVGQTFRPASAQLAGVDVATVTFARPADPAGVVEAELVDAGTGAVLARTRRPGAAVPDNGWLPLRFDEPVPAPELARLSLRWTSPQPIGVLANLPPADGGADGGPERPADPGSQRPADGGPERPVNDPYPHGSLVRDGTPAEGDLAFRVLGLDRGRALPRVVSGLLGGVGERLAARPAFGLAWALGLAGALALAVVGFRRQRRAATDELAQPGGDEQHGGD